MKWTRVDATFWIPNPIGLCSSWTTRTPLVRLLVDFRSAARSLASVAGFRSDGRPPYLAKAISLISRPRSRDCNWNCTRAPAHLMDFLHIGLVVPPPDRHFALPQAAISISISIIYFQDHSLILILYEISLFRALMEANQISSNPMQGGRPDRSASLGASTQLESD